MKKLKSICKSTLSYIAERRLLRYSIIVIILFLPIGTILTNKYLNSIEKNIEQIEETATDKGSINKNITKGNIDANAFIDKEVSKHTLSEGFSTLTDDDISSSSSNNSNQNNISSNTSSNVSHSIDKSSISGINLEILEGYEFNPRKDLKLQATDNDGRDITNNVIIEKNNVNTTIPGIYSVKASVRLSNGQTKEKEFTVTVKETRLDVSLETFKPIKTNVKKSTKIGFEVDLKVSKKHVIPTAVMINGQEYTLYKGNENIIDVLTNTKNYKVFIDASDTPGVYEYSLEHVKMSNGSWISLGENIASIEVLKSEASINNFNYEEKSKDKEVEIKFDLNDLENTTSNLRLEFYKDNSIVKVIQLDKKPSYLIRLPINSNGIYNLKILSDINLNQDINKDKTIQNKVIFDTTINISNIDQTSITGNNIEITQGDNFDFIKDLGLKATDFDGEDITDNIKLDGNNIDVNIEGEQSIVVYVLNKYGKKYTEEFNVTVIPVDENKFSLSRILFESFSENKSKASNTKSSYNKIITGNDNESFTQNVQVNGVVTKADGSLPAGRIEVELPTAMSFIVDEDGKIPTVNYIVDNKGTVDISIYVSGFSDSNANGGINVKPIDEDISLLDRSNVHLKLIGNTNKEVDLGKPINNIQEVLRVNAQQTGIIQLQGKAGKANDVSIDKNGTSDEFTLIFKIKKS